jgi:WhiB family redox-sensing transcriptional regulator
MGLIFYALTSKIPECSGEDPTLFVGPDGEERADRERREEEAKRFCRKCSLISKCLDWAIANREVGIWGGTNDDDRRALRTGRQIKIKGLTSQQVAKLERQKEAFRMYQLGSTVPEIAKSLGVKPDTAYSYIRDQKRLVNSSGEASSETEADCEKTSV